MSGQSFVQRAGKEIDEEWYNSPDGCRVLSSSPVRSQGAAELRPVLSCPCRAGLGEVRRETDTKKGSRSGGGNENEAPVYVWQGARVESRLR